MMRRGMGMDTRGFALLGLLLVLVIIALLVGAWYGLGGKQPEGEQGRATTTPGRAIEKARSVECASNLRQLRMLVQTEMSVEGALPRELNTGAGALSRCPVGGGAYGYDPRTGKVSCPTSGHESL